MKNLKIIKNNELKDWAEEIFKKNSFNMVDVSSKKETYRRALASGKIYVGKEVFNLIKNKEMPKGDPITLAEISAVLGVKKTSELIPLCHPIALASVSVNFDIKDNENTIKITSSCKLNGKTGLEMEALTAVSIAALTIYDMCKAVDREMIINETQLLFKSGGKSGTFNRND